MQYRVRSRSTPAAKAASRLLWLCNRTSTLCSHTRRAHLGNPRPPRTIMASQFAGALKDGGEICGARRNTCKRLHVLQRRLSSRARSLNRRALSAVPRRAESQQWRRASHDARRRQRCVCAALCTAPPPQDAASTHVWPARRAPPRTMSTLVARGTTACGGGGDTCCQAFSKEVVQPVDASPGRGQAHPRVAALLRSHTTCRHH